jgi:hypothetical protein
MRFFQWYVALHLHATLAIAFWRFGSPFGTLIPKMGIHLAVWRFTPSHSFALPGTWDVTPGLPSWPAPLQAFALVTNPRLGLRHWPNHNYYIMWFVWSNHGACWTSKVTTTQQSLWVYVFSKCINPNIVNNLKQPLTPRNGEQPSTPIDGLLITTNVATLVLILKMHHHQVLILLLLILQCLLLLIIQLLNLLFVDLNLFALLFIYKDISTLLR